MTKEYTFEEQKEHLNIFLYQLQNYLSEKTIQINLDELVELGKEINNIKDEADLAVFQLRFYDTCKQYQDQIVKDMLDRHFNEEKFKPNIKQVKK